MMISWTARHLPLLASLLLAPPLLWAPDGAAEPPPDAAELVRRAMDHWRGQSSRSLMTMTIHRPDWERTMTMESWSKGDELSLVRVIEPKRDA
ncbi:MAG: hypothetical protein EHM68_16435, partial [Lysobacterales bacterium]